MWVPVLCCVPVQRPDSPSGSPQGSFSRPAARTGPARSGSSSSRPGTAGAGVRTRSAAAAAGGGGGAAGGGAAAGEEDEASLSGMLLNATEAQMRLTELVGEGLAAELADPMWKVSLEGQHACCGAGTCRVACTCAWLGRVRSQRRRPQTPVSATEVARDWGLMGMPLAVACHAACPAEPAVCPAGAAGGHGQGRGTGTGLICSRQHSRAGAGHGTPARLGREELPGGGRGRALGDSTQQALQQTPE